MKPFVWFVALSCTFLTACGSTPNPYANVKTASFESSELETPREIVDGSSIVFQVKSKGCGEVIFMPNRASLMENMGVAKGMWCKKLLYLYV